MARRLFTSCPALSLPLCAAVCAAWVRSYRANDLFWWHRVWDDGDRSYHRQTLVSLGQGGVGMSWSVRSGGQKPVAGDGGTFREMAERVDIRFHRVERPHYPRFWTRRGADTDWHGFQYDDYAWPDPDPRRRPHGYSWKVVVPCWTLALATAIPPPAPASAPRAATTCGPRRGGARSGALARRSSLEPDVPTLCTAVAPNQNAARAGVAGGVGLAL
jgi:hypothetical protein